MPGVHSIVSTVTVETVTGAEDLDETKRLAPAVLRTLAMVEEAWKRDNLIRPGVEALISATVPTASSRPRSMMPTRG